MMTPIFTGFTAVLEDHDVRVNAKPWLAELQNPEGEDTPSNASVYTPLLSEDFDLPLVLPGAYELQAAIDIQPVNTPIQRLDHMLTLDDDGFLLDPTDDLDTQVGRVLADEAVEGPPVMPALGDDDFLLGKDSDLPLVLPGVDELDPAAIGFELADLPVQLFDHMMTLDDDGFLLGPTDDLGRLHDHDGWLF